MCSVSRTFFWYRKFWFISLFRGVTLVIAELANYLNAVQTAFFEIVSTNNAIVNFPKNVVTNLPASWCDTFFTAGNLGHAGAIVSSGSSNWTSNGTTALFEFYNSSLPGKQPLLSCGFPKGGLLGPAPFPYCLPQNDFYMQLLQVAHTANPVMSVRWVLTTVDSQPYQEVRQS